jgi:hypothetical protein
MKLPKNGFCFLSVFATESLGKKYTAKIVVTKAIIARNTVIMFPNIRLIYNQV